jgi:hypothetical protein
LERNPSKRVSLSQFYESCQSLPLTVTFEHSTQYEKTAESDAIEEDMIIRILKAREFYLDSHDITVLDKSPFQEFTIQCFGSTEDPLRMARLEMLKKKNAGKKMTFNYAPKGTSATVPAFRFDNTSGNEILNK